MKKPLGTVAYMGGLPAVMEMFTWSWGQMVQWNAEFLADESCYVHYDRAPFSDHAPARNSLATHFQGEWLLQLDTDHQFEPDLCGRLLRLADEFEVDVLTGVYQFKQPPHMPLLFHWLEQEHGEPVLRPILKWQPEMRIMEIGSAGGGCLFVRRKVFDKLHELDPQNQPFNKIHPYSEDHSFFIRLRRAGIKAYAGLRIESRHLRIAPVTLDDYDGAGVGGGDVFIQGDV